MKSGLRPRVIASAGPKAREQAKRGEEASLDRQKHGKFESQNVKANDGSGTLEVARVSVDTEVAWVNDALKREQITPAMATAADRLERNLRTIYGSPSQTASYSDIPGGGGGSVGPAIAAARSEVEALDRVVYPHVFNVLLDVLWEGKPTGDRRPTYRRWSDICVGLEAAACVWQIG